MSERVVDPGVGMGTNTDVGAAFTLSVVAFAVASTIVLLVIAVIIPSPPRHPAPADDDGGGPRIRLLSRVLFTRRQPDAITLDCLLVAVDQAGPGVSVPPGMPFTLQLRTPATEWFADRVERLLVEWSDENRELLLELREDHGKVRTKIASGDSTVQLELAGAAGLQLSS